MSVIIAKFIQTQDIKPHFLTCYIDDIFIIWTGTPKQLDLYLKNLIPIFTNILDTKTFQKQLNLYQYLHFTSNHPKNVFKALIRGECIRYIRTNSTQESYAGTVYAEDINNTPVRRQAKVPET